jgi:hypothetical protein
MDNSVIEKNKISILSGFMFPEENRLEMNALELNDPVINSNIAPRNGAIQKV